MTKKNITVWAKKSFVLWFIDNYPVLNENTVNILKELAQTEELLSKLKIVINGAYLRPLLIVSTEGIGMPPILYKTNDHSYKDPRQILEHLYLERDNSIYLTIYFPERSYSEPYLSIIEDSIALKPEREDQLLIDFELSLWFDGFKREQERTEILKQIDRSLAEGKKDQFRRLVKKMKNL